MDTITLAESVSRLGQLRDLEREPAVLHGYARAPGGPGCTDHIDPITGYRVHLGTVVARIRRETRDALMVQAMGVRGVRGQQADEEVAGDQGVERGGHTYPVTPTTSAEKSP
jgi:hypothetical protein